MDGIKAILLDNTVDSLAAVPDVLNNMAAQ